MQRGLVENAPTFLDEARDPEAYTLDLGALAAFGGPVLLTYGDQSLPCYAPIVFRVVAALPQACDPGHRRRWSRPAPHQSGRLRRSRLLLRRGRRRWTALRSTGRTQMRRCSVSLSR